MKSIVLFLNKRKSIFLFCLFTLVVLGNTFAQAEKALPAKTNSMLVNPTFYFLMGVVIIFLLIIVVLGSVLVTLAKNHLEKEASSKLPMIIAILGLTFVSQMSYGQTSAPIVEQQNFYGLTPFLFYFFCAVIVFEVFIIYVLYRAINKFLSRDETLATVPKKSWLMSQLSDAVPVENEESIMMDHVYDGIRELDNGMPPWLKYMFIGTIAFTIVYLFDYQVFHIHPLQLEEYKNELAEADVQMEAHRKNAANSIDESSVVLITDAAALNEAKTVFTNNCVACHGKGGEGSVGPNLTDDYWLHGGSIHDIFKTIKYGVVEKGMKSWQADISPAQIQAVVGYIKSLHGTNPPNAKEKQGELYTEGTSNKDLISTTDSLKTKNDTIIQAKK
jgi:cytochrome c oxidase cbb3-type subunit 3